MSVAVEYEVGEGEWLALHQASQQAHPDLRRLLSRATWFGFVGSATVDLTGMLFWYRVQFPFVLTFFSVYFVLTYLLHEVVAKRQLGRVMAGRSSLFAHHSVLVDDDGIRQRSDAHEVLVRWKAVSRLGETPDHLVVSVGGTPTIVIPKRAFGDARSLADFVAALRRRSP